GARALGKNREGRRRQRRRQAPQRQVKLQVPTAPTCGQYSRRTIACPVSGSTRPVSATQPVHCPTASSPRLVAVRGPSTNVHSARASAATPTPLQLGSGGGAPGHVYDDS